MPEIRFEKTTILVKKGINLKKALLRNGLSPYNGLARYLNCQGMGTCGTCAVSIEGKVSAKTKIEKWRLDFPPHKSDSGLRLACQVRVLGDLSVRKHNGFWGQQIRKFP